MCPADGAVGAVVALLERMTVVLSLDELPEPVSVSTRGQQQVPELPRTGSSPLVATAALLLLISALATRRLRLQQH